MLPAFESAAPRGDLDVVSSPATNDTAPVLRASCAADSSIGGAGGTTFGGGIAGITVSADVARRRNKRSSKRAAALSEARPDGTGGLRSDVCPTHVATRGADDAAGGPLTGPGSDLTIPGVDLEVIP